MNEKEVEKQIERRRNRIESIIYEGDEAIEDKKELIELTLREVFELKGKSINGNGFYEERNKLFDKIYANNYDDIPEPENKDDEFENDEFENDEFENDEFENDEFEKDEFENDEFMGDEPKEKHESQDKHYAIKGEIIRNQYRSVPMPKSNEKLKIYNKNRARIKFIEILRGLIDFRKIKKEKDAEIILDKTQKEIAKKLGMEEWQITRDIHWGIKFGFIKKNKNRELVLGEFKFKPTSKTNKDTGKRICKLYPSWFEKDDWYNSFIVKDNGKVYERKREYKNRKIRK